MKNCRFCSFKIMTVEYRPPLCVWCIRMNLKMNFKEPVYLQHISVYRSDTMLHITKPLFLKKIPKSVYNTWRKLSTGSCLADACSPESMWFVCCHLFLPNTMYFVVLCIFALQSRWSTRLSSISDCVVPFRHSAFGLSSFSVKAIIQWDTLPEDSRIEMFKLKLKT